MPKWTLNVLYFAIGVMVSVPSMDWVVHNNEPWPGTLCCVLSHSASLHPGVQMGAGELNAGNPAID